MGRIAIEVLRCVARSGWRKVYPRKLMPASSGSVEPTPATRGQVYPRQRRSAIAGRSQASGAARCIRARLRPPEIELVALIIDDGHSAKSPLVARARFDLSRCRERDDALHVMKSPDVIKLQRGSPTLPPYCAWAPAYRSVAVRVVWRNCRLVSGAQTSDDRSRGFEVTDPFGYRVRIGFVEIYNNIAVHSMWTFGRP